MPLTPRQVDVLRAVEALTARRGFCPTGREIARETNLSESRVRQHLSALQSVGRIARPVGAVRAIATFGDCAGK